MWRVPVAVLSVLVAGCSAHGSAAPGPADSGPGEDAAEAGNATLSALTVSTGTLRPAFDPNTTDYDVTALNSVYPISITATTTDPSGTLTILGAPAQSGAPSTLTLQPKQDMTVVVSEAGLTPTTYTVHYVPSDLPPYTVTQSASQGTENVLIVPQGQYLLIVDRAGDPIYYRTFLPDDVDDFQQITLPDGTIQYSAAVGIFDPSGWTLGVDHLMDDHFNDLGDYQPLAYAQHGAEPAESHEFLVLGPDHFVVMSYVQRTLDLSTINPAWSAQAVVMSGLFQEIQSGQVLVEWDSANVPSLYSDSLFENQFGPIGTSGVNDYLHLNSIDVDPSDGNFIVSFRHTSSIVKIDRHTAQILWTLGGKEDQYGLSGTQVFSFQHYVKMRPDGSMTIFDNGYSPVAGTGHPTRILQLTLDQTAHQVTSFNVLYTKPDGQPQTTFMGSDALLSGGRLFCGWGGWYTTGLAPAATEIINGSPVWSLELQTPGYFSYRAQPVATLSGSADGGM